MIPKAQWSFRWDHATSTVSFFIKGEGTCVTPFFASRLDFHLWWTYQGLLCQVHQRNQIATLASKRGWNTLWGWGTVQGFVVVMSHHEFQRWMIVQPFYNGVIQPARSTIDATTGGTLMNKTEDEAATWLRRWYSIITNGPIGEANPIRLEVSWNFMLLLYFLLK